VSATFTALLPEIILGVVASFVFLGGTWKQVNSSTWGVASLIGLALSFAAVIARSGDHGAGLNSLIVVDGLTVAVELATLVLGFLLVLTALSSQSAEENAAEFFALLLLMLTGVMLVSVANDLVLLFLSLELISVPTYVLLYSGRRDYGSQESALKYFLLSVLSAAILLYGFSFVYGLTGATNLTAVRDVLTATYAVGPTGTTGDGSVLGMVALVLLFSGLGFKIAAVPFHFYAPDVYQGTTAMNAGLLSVLPKVAGIVAIIRLTMEALVGFEAAGESVALILALISMSCGNCLALLQNNVRRMMAYSGIAHAGYLLIGIAIGFWDISRPEATLNAGTGLPGGVRACLLYLAAYSLATVGLFAVLHYLPRKGRQIDTVDDLTGLVRSQPLMAICAAIFLFSLSGIPPLPGFWGKLGLFSGALAARTPDGYIQLGFLLLAIVGVINAAIGAVYYLRIVAVMFLNDPLTTHQPEGGRSAYLAAGASAMLVLLLGILPGPAFQVLSSIDSRSITQQRSATVPVVVNASPVQAVRP
jgi:NADH-quinone oxidoreductase subunit N